MRTANVRAIYTVRELAEMAGISRRRMARKLRAEGITLQPERPRRGQPQTVCLCQLRGAWPDLWDSMVLLSALEAR